MNDKELKQIDTDIFFFFLLIICTLISFSLILERKRTILNTNKLSIEKQNSIYHVNRFIILIIAIYFVINSYKSLEEMKKEEKNIVIIKNQESIFIASCLSLVAAYLYYNSKTESETLIYY